LTIFYNIITYTRRYGWLKIPIIVCKVHMSLWTFY